MQKIQCLLALSETIVFVLLERAPCFIMHCYACHLTSKSKRILLEVLIFPPWESILTKLFFSGNTYHVLCSSPNKISCMFSCLNGLLVKHQTLFFMVTPSISFSERRYVYTAFQAHVQLNTVMATAHTWSQLEASHFQIRNKVDTLGNVKSELISCDEKQCALAKVHCLTHTASRQVSKLAERIHICLQNTV